MGSINDSRINVKKCASRNGLKLRSANTARSMHCNTAVQDRGRRLNQSQFRSMAEVSFLLSANTRKRASASREQLVVLFNINLELEVEESWVQFIGIALFFALSYCNFETSAASLLQSLNRTCVSFNVSLKIMTVISSGLPCLYHHDVTFYSSHILLGLISSALSGLKYFLLHALALPIQAELQ